MRLTQFLAIAFLSTGGLLPPMLAAQTVSSGAPDKARTLSDDTVRAVQTLTMNTPYGSLPRGFAESSGSSTKLFIVSARNMIASRTAEAAGSGGRFNPPPDMRRDIVFLSCGDHDFREVFECARVRLSSDGKAIEPLSYEAKQNSYRNALGASWDVREVFATFDARDLLKGFAVDYADPTGGEWTYTVTPEQAGVDLMLDIASAAAATAPTGPVPPQLRITVARVGQAWRITNGDPFRWPQCIASIGASEAPMGALEANAALMVNPSQFQPPLTDPATKSAVTITCTVGRDQVFIATGRP